MLARDCIPKSMDYLPGFTSGRGATISDLDSTKLSYIHDKIKDNIGYSAASNFVDMVQDLEVPACTIFLNTLYDLERNDWVYVKGDKKSDVHIENEGELVGTMMASRSRKQDDTLLIVSDFLQRFGKKHITVNGSRMNYSDPRVRSFLYQRL